MKFCYTEGFFFFFFCICWWLRKYIDGENIQDKQEEASWLLLSTGSSGHSKKEAVSDSGCNIHVFSLYWCASLVGETMFYISCMLPRPLILLTKYWRYCLDHLLVSFQLWYSFSNQIAWGKKEGRITVVTDINGIYASHPQRCIL